MYSLDKAYPISNIEFIEKQFAPAGPLHCERELFYSMSDQQQRARDWRRKWEAHRARAFQRFPLPRSRWGDLSRYREAKRQWHDTGRRDARLLAEFHKHVKTTGRLDCEAGLTLCLIGTSVGAMSKLPRPFLKRIGEIRRAFESGAWVPPTWTKTLWRRVAYDLGQRHFCHVSVVDSSQVAYYPTVTHLLAGREVRVKPGRYLTKHFSDQFSEVEIREMANEHLAEVLPKPLNFVENDDPDGWEWVYEHGRGFTSCMTYNRSGRYLDADLHGKHHPVRAYAYPGNGLRLAWLGDATKFKKDLLTDNIVFQTTMDGRRQLRRWVPELDADGVQDLPPEDLRRFAFKMATGSGKTWVMAMAVVWSYFHKKLVPASPLSTNFLIVAPNVIVYQRLERDFAANRIFYELPLIPPEWRGAFSQKVILRGEAAEPDPSGNLLLTNVQQLYASRDEE